ENFDNSTQVFNFPEKDDYAFYEVECSNGVTGSFDTMNWTFSRNDREKQTSCDVYFKKVNEDNEIYYKIMGNNETSKISKNKPDNNGLYRYRNISCSNVKDYSFDETTFDFKINEYEKNALCVVNFETDITLENSDRFTVYFDPQGGAVKTHSKIALKGGRYGSLPTPTFANHIFLGWFTDAGTEITNTNEVTIDSDIKLYAHWSEAPQVDVTLHALNKILGTDLIQSIDDYGTSYYFPSTSTNNYIKYANLYWRIIRINGDGSLRIVYDGDKIHDNGEVTKDRTIGASVWNSSNSNDNKYLGYMYGYENGIASTTRAQAISNSTNSNVKATLEKWYKENIVDDSYHNNVHDAIFCNDRSTSDEYGFGTIPTRYGASLRLLNEDGTAQSNPSPLLTCTYKADAFTVKDTERGNGSLDYPIGLLTMDEIFLIGGTGEGSYLNRGTSFWTSTPSRFDTTAKMMIAGSDTLEAEVTSTHSVVPVINLNPEYSSILVGDGSKENPYFVR
ncbi:MAG TPA: hypothetical protein DCY94_01775, partial [Firmicutes bacterium]|nr:hypothetical protein [Bacillota bacterium]